MRKSAKENRPFNLKPVKRIELSDKNKRLRATLAILFLCIGVVAIGTGVYNLLTPEPGWTVIKTNSSELNCSDEFVFNYCLGMGEESVASEQKNITAIYANAAVHAYKVFNEDEAFEGIGNIFSINSNIGDEVTVDPLLYQALALTLAKGNRALYVSALYAEYKNNFFGYDTSSSLEDNDPYKNGELASLFKQMADFASNNEHIRLHLLGYNKVKLVLSEEYLAFAQEYEINKLIGFSYFKNAFIADYFAKTFTEAGYTYGNISSKDGFVRNFDSFGKEEYAFNIFNRRGNEVYIATSLTYKGDTAIVSLRDYPMVEGDIFKYYTKKNGESIHGFINLSDGLYRTATDTLTLYSKTGAGCAEIFLSAIDAYTSDSLSLDAIKTLTDKNIHSLWCDNGVIKYTEKNLLLSVGKYENDTSYKSEFVFD